MVCAAIFSNQQGQAFPSVFGKTETISETRLGAACSDIELATQAIALLDAEFERAQEEELFTIERFDESHLGDLLVLSDSLGLEDEVSRLLDETDRADLSDMLTAIVYKVEEVAKKQIKASREKVLDSLVELFAEQGKTVNKVNLKKAWDKRGDLGALELSINNSANTNFDGHNEIYLSLSSDYTDCTFISTEFSTITDDEVCNSTMGIIQKWGLDSFALAKPDALFSHIYNYYTIYDAADGLFDKEHLDLEEITDKVMKSDFVYENMFIDHDDEESMEEARSNVQCTIIDMLRIIQPPKEAEATFLSKWFDGQFQTLNEDWYDRRSHNIPMDFVTNSDDVINELNMNFDSISEECESRIKVNATHAIEFLVTLFTNRSLITLFDCILCHGREQTVYTQKWLTEMEMTDSSSEKLL